jgi:hypothetical protein
MGNKCKFCNGVNTIVGKSDYINQQLKDVDTKIDGLYAQDWFPVYCIDCGKTTVYAFISRKRKML